MPPLDIGRRKHRVTVQTPTETTDAFGQTIQSWTDAFTDWARVRPPTGREAVNANQLKAQLDYVVTMTYREGIDETSQLLWKGHVLRLTRPPIPDEMEVSMDLYCAEQTSETTS